MSYIIVAVLFFLAGSIYGQWNMRDIKKANDEYRKYLEALDRMYLVKTSKKRGGKK